MNAGLSHLTFVILFVFISFPLTAQKARYASFLEKGEEVLFEDYQTLSTKLKDGTFRYRQFFPEKMLMTDLTSYTDSRRSILQGPHRAWFDNGHRKLEATYEDGLLQGPYREYAYSNDSLITLGQFAYGEKEGEWVSYYSSGSVREKKHYLKGKQEGEFIAYDTLGVITEQGLMQADTVFSYSIEKAPSDLESMPRFPGCEEIEDKDAQTACAKRKMLEFVYATLRYPARAAEKDVQGKAEVRFVVEKDGSITEIEVRRGLNSDISRELERIISKMPTWHPGYKQGEPVRVQFFLPVTFKLQ
ncbi:energy transducer TonB [Neolewinella persica]|uniref:energy transducer TonB n=1 Tax=Neolewinella persica TaxID=70998 RepID=UPI000378D92A|nr:energy transducer TonB [Neolewinella persica]